MLAFFKSPYAARESFPPLNDMVTGFFLFPMNDLMSLTPLDSMVAKWSTLAATNSLCSEAGPGGRDKACPTSLINMAPSLDWTLLLSTRATPLQTSDPTRTMSGSPERNGPVTSLMALPSTFLPLRCPSAFSSLTRFLVACLWSNAAPSCRNWSSKSFRLRSKRMVAMTMPSATISSERSSPATLFRKTILPSMQAELPKCLSKSSSTTSLPCRMAGRMSPGNETSKGRPGLRQVPQLGLRSKVPQASHQWNVALPCLGSLMAIGRPSAHSLQKCMPS